MQVFSHLTIPTAVACRCHYLSPPFYAAGERGLEKLNWVMNPQLARLQTRTVSFTLHSEWPALNLIQKLKDVMVLHPRLWDCILWRQFSVGSLGWTMDLQLLPWKAAQSFTSPKRGGYLPNVSQQTAVKTGVKTHSQSAQGQCPSGSVLGRGSLCLDLIAWWALAIFAQ